MKLVVVSRDETLKSQLAYHLEPVGFELLHLDDPVQTMESVESMDPEMILCHAGDFPRLWKPLLQLIRERRSKEETVFVLLKPDKFDFEEGAKASHLGINGIVSADLNRKQQIHQLEELFRRYRSLQDKRRFHRLVPGVQDRLQLLFTHPYSLKVITGVLQEISIQGASFSPSDPELTRDLKPNQDLPLCTLRAGEDVFSLQCRITHGGKEIGLQFLTFETGGHHKLFEYIQNHAQRELKKAINEAR